jgi:DNA polymerase I-like protein with 3'-5' exonuclease and polymerase domains/5'-3' exonuclease
MTLLAFDMSSYLKTGLLAGKDEKDGRTVLFNDQTILVNSAEYGYENVINMMVRTLEDCNVQPHKCLLVFEGRNSKSRRIGIDAAYKAHRDQRPPEFYEEFGRLRDYIEHVWKNLGAIALTADFVEGDDTLAWLAQETEEDLIIASRDGDMGALNTDEGTNAYGAKVTTWNDGLRGAVKLGGELFVHPSKYITLYKATVGDKNDGIAGVKGFGPGAFQKLAETYGYDGLDEFMGLLEAGDLGPLYPLAEEMVGKGKSVKPAHPLIKTILASEKAAITSWKLAKMHPEWVNTMSHPISVRPGKCAPPPMDVDSRLAHWYAETALVTQSNYADALAFFKSMIDASPELVFDIETSTPDESDDWLAAQDNPDGVDQIGSVLTGFSWTFGPNLQYTVYVSVDHANTDNISMVQARRWIEAAADSGKSIVIQNTMFELGVLYMAQDEDGTHWRDHWKDNGFYGFLPNVLDTKLEASYVNENVKTGLKDRSKLHLDYEQVKYEVVTTMTGRPVDLPAGGRLIEFSPDGEQQARKYKMRELTAEHVMAYGCDDTICTAALHNYYRLMMHLEHQYKVYLDVEIEAAYLHAKNFVDGVAFSLEKMNELRDIDDITYDKAWATVRSYLMEHGWDGTVPPVYTADITVAQIKEAYKIVQGYNDENPQDDDLLDAAQGEEGEEPEVEAEEDAQEEPDDPFLKTRVRKLTSLLALLRELGHELFAGMLEQCIAGQHEKFTAWVNTHFTGEPRFAISNKQMTKLLYDVMKLPVRVRNKPTKIMRQKGLEGNPKGDALAIEYALRDATPEQKAVLESLKLLQMVKTRRSLYYTKYPHFVHWKTGRIHPSHNQCATNTRRASSSKPNIQQLSKAPKITGQPARIREVIVPHRAGAVIVSLDEDSQELRMIADYSQDANMVACFVGENKKDMHALTGHSIAVKKNKVTLAYEEFAVAAKDKLHVHHAVCKEYRAKGKTCNFATEFGAMAPKLAMTMLVPEDEAQIYIDAKEAMFPGVRVWKNGVIEEAKRLGYVLTKSGARRHLREALTGDDHWVRSKAERQAVNFKIQSSSAEMIKRAEGTMWREGLVFKYDCVCYGSIHDEVVFSVMIEDLLPFLQDAHRAMVQPYGGMTIPIVSSISFGPTFGQQAEIGSEPTAEAIAKGWAEIKEMLRKYEEATA